MVTQKKKVQINEEELGKIINMEEEYQDEKMEIDENGILYKDEATILVNSFYAKTYLVLYIFSASSSRLPQTQDVVIPSVCLL